MSTAAVLASTMALALLLLAPLQCAQGHPGPSSERRGRQVDGTTTAATSTAATTTTTAASTSTTTTTTAAATTAAAVEATTAIPATTASSSAEAATVASTTPAPGSAGYWGLLGLVNNKPHLGAGGLGLGGHAAKWGHLARPVHLQQQGPAQSVPAQHVLVTPVKWTHFVPQAALQASWLDSPATTASTTTTTTTPPPPPPLQQQQQQQDLLLVPVPGSHPLASRVHNKHRPSEGLLVGLPAMLRPAGPAGLPTTRPSAVGPAATKPLTVTLVALKKPGLGLKAGLHHHKDGLHRSGALQLPDEPYADGALPYDEDADEQQPFVKAAAAEPCPESEAGGGVWWWSLPETMAAQWPVVNAAAQHQWAAVDYLDPPPQPQRMPQRQPQRQWVLAPAAAAPVLATSPLAPAASWTRAAQGLQDQLWQALLGLQADPRWGQLPAPQRWRP